MSCEEFSPMTKLQCNKNFLNMNFALASVAQFVGCCPMHWKVAGLIAR